jgi:Hint module
MQCLSGYNMVKVKDIGYIPLHQLRIGDMVHTSSLLDTTSYSRVYSFGHYTHHIVTEYIQLYVNNDEWNNLQATDELDNMSTALPLEITSQHLIFVTRKLKKQIHNNNDNIHYPPFDYDDIITAGHIQVGDILSGNQTVTSIQYVNRTGVYAPMTETGDIMMNRNKIRVSCYVQLLDPHDNNIGRYDDDYNTGLKTQTLLNQPLFLSRMITNLFTAQNQHWLAHTILGPYRMICHYDITICQHYETYDPEFGYSYVVAWIIYFSSMIQSPPHHPKPIIAPPPPTTTTTIPTIMIASYDDWTNHSMMLSMKILLLLLFLFLVLAFGMVQMMTTRIAFWGL